MAERNKRARMEDAPEVQVDSTETVGSNNDCRRNEEKDQEGQHVISYDAVGNILSDFQAPEFVSHGSPLLVTPTMTALFQKLEDTIQRDQGSTSTTVLLGPSGVGKTTTLLYIGHMARKKGYLVFPIQARDFVNQARPMGEVIRLFLFTWIEAVGEDILKATPARLRPYYKSLYEIANRTGDERDIINSFIFLVQELQVCVAKPVVFLISHFNAFHQDSPKGNPVRTMFLDWNTFQVKRGAIIYEFSSALQFLPDAPDGHGSCFLRIEPMNQDDFQAFVDVLVKPDQLAQDQEFDFDDFFELCGGIPREALEYVTGIQRLMGDERLNFADWQDSYKSFRVPFYKMRMEHLLDNGKLGIERVKESLSFASSLFLRENVVSAPNDWIVSGLIVTEDGFLKLLCPAAEEALSLVFHELKVTRQAIHSCRNDSMTKWRGYALAGIYHFRCSVERPIKLYCTDLWGDNERALTIVASAIENGGPMLPLANSIPRNTVYVCLRKAPVVEFFIHHARGAQFLIVVSDSSHHDHNPKYLYYPDDRHVQAYAAAARDPIPATKVQYVYMTPRRPSHTMPMNQQTKNVLLVADDDRKRFLERLLD